MVKTVLLCPFWRQEYQDLRPLNTSMGTCEETEAFFESYGSAPHLLSSPSREPQ